MSIPTRKAYCINCGEVEPLLDGKCPKCKFRTSPLSSDTPAPSSIERAVANPVALPPGKATRLWAEQTSALHAAICAQRDRLKAKIATDTVELQRLERAALAMENLLKQVSIPEDSGEPKDSGRTGGRTGGRWARAYDGCVECGTTTSAHAGKGRCQRCTQRARYKAAAA